MYYFLYSDTKEGSLIFQILLLLLPLRHSRARSGALFLPHPQPCLISYICEKRPKSKLFQSKGTTTDLWNKGRQFWVSHTNAATWGQSGAKPALLQLPARVTALVGRYRLLFRGETRVWANQALNAMERWTVWPFQWLIFCSFVFSYQGDE